MAGQRLVRVAQHLYLTVDVQRHHRTAGALTDIAFGHRFPGQPFGDFDLENIQALGHHQDIVAAHQVDDGVGPGGSIREHKIRPGAVQRSDIALQVGAADDLGFRA